MHPFGMRGVLFGLACIIALCGMVLMSVSHSSNRSLAFFERHFGFSPDGGDGSMEILLLVALAMVVAAVGLSFRSPVK